MKSKIEVIDLGYPIGKLIENFADDGTQKSSVGDELFIVVGDDCTEGFPYSPAKNISIFGDNIIKLRDFLNKHYPKD